MIRDYVLESSCLKKCASLFTPYTSENVHVQHGEGKCSRTASTQFQVHLSTLLEYLLQL